MKKILKIYFLCFAIVFAGALFFAGNLRIAKAAGPLELIMTDPLFSVSNVMPGQVISSDVTLKNHGDHHEDFQFEVDVKTNTKALADHLFFKVTDGAGGCLFGCDNNITLSYLDGREPNIARVDPHSTTYYKFVITFDPTAENEFQSASTTFDMKLGFEGTTTTANGGGGGVPGTGTATTGLLAPFATLTGTTTGIQTGEETLPGQEGEVKGEETAPGIVEGDQVSICQGWPKWVWVLMLIAYFAAFLWRTFEKIKEQIEKQDIRWKWQTVLAVAAFLIWYVFDKCREFWWFVILAMIGGAIIYLLYLYLFRKNIREEHAKVESGSEQDAPKTPTGQIPPTV